MEQQDTSDSSPPPPTNRRDSLPARLSNLSTAFPTSKSTSPSPPHTTSLSASEPTLRFPKPLGNRQLANWVSSSNPDIMRLTTTTEDTGLSESTYELISGGNTDTESQDGRYASLSDSISSLDLHRPDDAHSLAGTEQNYDDESVIDESEAYQPATPDHDEEEEDEEEEDEEEDEEYDDDEDDEEAHEDTIMAASQATNEPSIQSLSDSEHEARSRSSIEYTQQSLKTPSLPPTPESSRLVGRAVKDPQGSGGKGNWNKLTAQFVEIDDRIRDYFTEALYTALPGLIFVVAIALVLPIVYNTPQKPNSLVNMHNASAAAPAVATAVASHTTPSTYSTSSSRPTSTPTSGVGLIPIGGDAPSDEWAFGAKKPVISFTPEAHNDILIHIPQGIKKTWLAKGCLTVTAKRGDVLVETTMSQVDEGMLLKFAKKEAHGIVNLVLETTCRPKVHKVVKVHFGKGMMEEAFGIAKDLAQDLSGLVPAAAQEAERAIEEAKRSFELVCQNVCQNIQSASETVAKTFGFSLPDTHQSLENIASGAFNRIKGATEEIANKLDTATEQASKHIPAVEDVQNQLQLKLLDAQISAKIWWLKATSRQEEREEYQRKAKTFVAKKHAAAEEASQERRKRYEEATEPVQRLWSKFMGKS